MDGTQPNNAYVHLFVLSGHPHCIFIEMKAYWMPDCVRMGEDFNAGVGKSQRTVRDQTKLTDVCIISRNGGVCFKRHCGEMSGDFHSLSLALIYIRVHYVTLIITFSYSPNIVSSA